MRKILLNNKRSKKSINNENIIPIEINRDISLLHDEMLNETIDIMKVYNDEKDKSTKHRFIFTLYPYCSNVLFNKLTEIVYKEGSDECYSLNNNEDIPKPSMAISNEKVNRTQAIRNTEYSNNIFNYTYHCGADIFNNHIFRSKENNSVMSRNDEEIRKNVNSFKCLLENIDKNSSNLIDSFNTIGDYARQYNGNIIKVLLPGGKNYVYNLNDDNKKKLPLYLNDTILSFNDSYKNNIQKKEGWVGFYNKSNLQIPVKRYMDLIYILGTDNLTDINKWNNGEKLEIFNGDVSFSKPTNNISYGINTLSNNEEPSTKTNETSNTVSNSSESNNDDNEYLINKVINNKNACQFIDLTPERDLFYFTPKKNKERNRIEYNWYYFLTYPYKSEYSTNFTNKNRSTELLLGKRQGLPFVSFSNIEVYKEYIGANGLKLLMFRSAVKHNLKKNDIVNIKFSNDKNINCTIVNTGTLDNKYNDRYFSIQKEDIIDFISDGYKPERFAKVVSGFECEYYFRKFKKIINNITFDIPKSNINKLAFTNTIYGDEVSQIVYTDDIDILNYKDNRGRSLTEVYLTIIKNNQGYDLWYNKNNFTSEDIEYSHIFGKVSSGLDLPDYSGLELPVVRYQHNINENKLDILELQSSSSKIEEDINKDDDEFYGDLIEFNPITLNETILEDVFYRFNTAQRETNNEIYNTIYYDELGSDIYDKDSDDYVHIKQHSLNKGYANLAPEGYIYKPHYKIQIKNFNNTINQLSDTIMDVSDVKLINPVLYSSKSSIIIDNTGTISLNIKINANTEYKLTYSYDDDGIGGAILENDDLMNPLIIGDFGLGRGSFISNKNLFSVNFISEGVSRLKNLIIYTGINPNKKITFSTYNNYLLLPNDNISFMDENSNLYKLKVISYIFNNISKTYKCEAEFSNNVDLNNIPDKVVFFKNNLEIPDYGYMLPDKSGRRLWKDIIKPSEYSNLDELYSIPFTNGAFYHHNNINFFIKRQDPFKNFGMFVKKDGMQLENNFDIPAIELDTSVEEYNVKIENGVCF